MNKAVCKGPALHTTPTKPASFSLFSKPARSFIHARVGLFFRPAIAIAIAAIFFLVLVRDQLFIHSTSVRMPPAHPTWQVSVFRQPRHEKNALLAYLDAEDQEATVGKTGSGSGHDVEFEDDDEQGVEEVWPL